MTVGRTPSRSSTALATGSSRPITIARWGANRLLPKVADFNGDGLLDVITRSLLDHSVTILLGSAEGGFDQRIDFRVDDMPTTLEIGHLDSDAQMDWITASIEADTFSPHQNLPGAWSTAHAAECTLPADPGPSGGSPVADAGDDGSAAPGQAVILDASGSVGSGTGSVLAYHWEQIAGEVV